MGICFSSSKKTSAKAKENTPASPKQKQRNSSASQSQNQTQNRNQQQEKAGVKRTTSVAQVPCGKRTNFGYHRDFENNYAIGKLLGHGQFGYTFVATHKVNGKKVAVKRIDKSKVDRFLRGLPKNSLGFSLSLTQFPRLCLSPLRIPPSTTKTLSFPQDVHLSRLYLALSRLISCLSLSLW